MPKILKTGALAIALLVAGCETVPKQPDPAGTTDPASGTTTQPTTPAPVTTPPPPVTTSPPVTPPVTMPGSGTPAVCARLHQRVLQKCTRLGTGRF